jgi:hypothetical protein
MYELKDFVKQNGFDQLPFEEQLAKFKEFKTATSTGASNRPTKTWTGENGNMMYLDATGNVVDTGVKGSPPGNEIVNVGGVSYVKETLPGGEPRFTPLDEYQTNYRQGQIEGEEGSKVKGTEYAKRDQAFLDFVDTGELDRMEQSIANTERLLQEMDNGEYQNTGYFEGPVRKIFGDPEAAKLEFNAMAQALENLQITNLAPVTENEIEMIKQLYSSIGSDPAQNKAILGEALRVLKEKQALVNKKGEYFANNNGTLRGFGTNRWTKPTEPAEPENVPTYVRDPETGKLVLQQ